MDNETVAGQLKWSPLYFMYWVFYKNIYNNAFNILIILAKSCSVVQWFVDFQTIFVLKIFAAEWTRNWNNYHISLIAEENTNSVLASFYDTEICDLPNYSQSCSFSHTPSIHAVRAVDLLKQMPHINRCQHVTCHIVLSLLVSSLVVFS